MTAIQRQRVVWSGMPGGPGLSTFYFSDAAAAQGALHTFLEALKGALPQDVTLTMEPGGDVIEDTNGALTAVWAGTLQTPSQGTANTSGYAAASGFLIRWETLRIVSGSRLRGRTYVVPAEGALFGTNGQLSTSDAAGWGAAANDFVGAVTPNLVVWQRPRSATVAYTDGRGIPHKALAGRLGSSGIVVSASVPVKGVVLRSRRD